MTRRTVVALLGGAVAWVTLAPAATLAQQQRVRSIGFLGANTPQTAGHLTAAFVARLKDLGWVEGKNLNIEYRWAAGQTSKFRVLADELLALGAEVIVTSGDAAGRAARAATQTIPIVMASSVDPVGSGLAASIPRPGGNVTGLTSTHDELAGKRLQLLKELVPDLDRVALLRNPDASQSDTQAVRAAASTLGFTVDVFDFRKLADLEAIATFPERTAIKGLMVLSEPLVFSNRVAINAFAASQRLPTMHSLREYTVDGGLMAYGPDFNVQFARAGDFVDKILKGAKPADLPFERPTKFALVINLKTAKTLGLTLPPTLLGRADEVIE
jgi:putative tryptophan/tyrosine transport system substrate-binding protein